MGSTGLISARGQAEITSVPSGLSVVPKVMGTPAADECTPLPSSSSVCADSAPDVIGDVAPHAATATQAQPHALVQVAVGIVDEEWVDVTIHDVATMDEAGDDTHHWSKLTSVWPSIIAH